MVKARIAAPMSSPDLTHAEIAAVNQVLATRYLSIGLSIKIFGRGFHPTWALPAPLMSPTVWLGCARSLSGEQRLDASWLLCYTGAAYGDETPTVEEKKREEAS